MHIKGEAFYKTKLMRGIIIRKGGYGAELICINISPVLPLWHKSDFFQNAIDILL